MKEILKNNKAKFILYAALLVLIKQLLVCNLPIYAIGTATYDDRLMIDMAASLLRFNWLGDFTCLTFVKGMFFPLFLAVNAALGISYVNAVSLLYSCACLVFILSIKDLFEKKWPLYVIFAFILFNPIMYSLDVTGRVYRNSLTPAQVLLILSSMFALFIYRRSEKKLVWWSMLGGLSLASFWNTREDAVWVLPTVVVFILIMFVGHILQNKSKFNVKRLIVFILPLIILGACNIGVSFINYKQYGTYTRVDESGTAFADAVKAIYSVPAEEQIDYATVTKEKLERLYAVSPSLNAISESLNRNCALFDSYGRIPDGEVEDGWFWWALRFAANEKGYFQTAQTAEDFFTSVTNEINEAQQRGVIGKQQTMPSALMSPWRKGYTSQLFAAMGKTIGYSVSYTDVEARAAESVGGYNSIKLFEIVTNDAAIMPNIYATGFNGWYRCKTSACTVECVDTTTGKLLGNVSAAQGEPASLAFSLDGSVPLENIALVAYDSTKTQIETLYLRDMLTKEDSDVRSYDINEYTLVNSSQYQLKVAGIYAAKLNVIKNIYKYTGVIFAVAGLLAYLFITFTALFKDRSLFDKWIVLSSVLGSYLVLCVGVAYSEISSFGSINPLYLSGAYPLIIMFWSMAVCMFIEYTKPKKSL